MTRGLRKRHLAIWIVLAIVLAVFMTLGRMATPVFQGDRVTNVKSL